MSTANLARLRNKNAGRSLRLDPPLDRDELPVLAFTDHSGDGVNILSRVPKRWPKNDPSYRGHLWIPEQMVSEHVWVETNRLGIENRKSTVHVVRFLRVHTRAGALVLETADRRLLKPVGKHALKRQGYVKRINKKWAKLGLTVSGPKLSPINVRIGAATLARIRRSIEDGNNRIMIVTVPPARRTDIPFDFGRQVYARPFN